MVTGMGSCTACLGQPGFPCGSCPCTFLPGPAAAAGAFTVGAVDDHNTASRADDTITTDLLIAPATGPQKPDLVAPGVSIVSAQADTVNGYVSMSGTSAAAAHVAGCAALLLNIQNIDPPGAELPGRVTRSPPILESRRGSRH